MNHYLYTLCTAVLLFSATFSDTTFGQEANILVDSVHILPGYMVVVGDSVMRFGKDTTICLPRDSKYKIKKDKDT
jgi:hypothetical protein